MKIQDTYIQQVRAALWGGEAAWPADQSGLYMRMHAMQGTGPLVFPGLLENKYLPADARMQMKGVCLSTMQQQVRIGHVFVQAWTAMEKAGIRPVLMKGAGLAALYPEVQMRTWGDIDLFVGKDQYHPACAVMRETFPDALKFDEELDHYKHYNLIADGISIEIHRVTVGLQHPVDERRYARMEHDGMANSEPLDVNGLTVRVPEPTFNALFVFMHSWEHMMTKGANIRQLCDLALLLHHYRDRIDRARLGKWLKALHLFDVWQVYMSILADGLGLPSEEALFYDRSDRITQRSTRLFHDLLKGVMVAPEPDKKAPKNRLLRKAHTMRERLRNAQRIRRYSPEFARHMVAETMLHGALRFFAKDRHWE